MAGSLSARVLKIKRITCRMKYKIGNIFFWFTFKWGTGYSVSRNKAVWKAWFYSYRTKYIITNTKINRHKVWPYWRQTHGTFNTACWKCFQILKYIYLKRVNINHLYMMLQKSYKCKQFSFSVHYPRVFSRFKFYNWFFLKVNLF